ncbi:MAG: AAA family ATPase [Candidatus Pacebacteria bacterium]|nr:AAA family ATPase [Candidatus Paceibacterota bacterium]MDD4994392.1 AAA family ATPase [Candidatus Paceibacterota bacterium]MDD5535097.1 AAA family ATPase [Candidatus Paceibacterota bacterium]
MFLKQIILKNFKSFAGKTVLDFPVFFTAIVGPNGSGKSNIVDAIRWALGEQSFKNLRAGKGSDLIFSSNKKNSSAGFAEVELVFDNTKGFFPLEFSEVSLLRRIDKEDNNSYFLNHQPCRLKDIIETSAAAKLGLKGFSIINQGSVENILKVSAQERRIMLEENLGLKNLEIKKEEAKRKLENTLINLDKIQSLRQEVLPHLRSLKRQVVRWEKMEKMKEELVLLEKKYFINVYNQILKERIQPNVDFNKIKQEIKSIERFIEDESRKIGLLDEQNDKSLEIEIRNLTGEIIELQNKKSSLLKDLGQREASSNLAVVREPLEKKVISLKEELQLLLSFVDLEKIKQKIQVIINDIDSFINPEDNLSEKKEDEKVKEIKSILEKIDVEINGKNRLLNQLQEQQNAKSLDFKLKFKEIESKRAEKERLYRELQREEILNEKFELHLEDFKRRLEESGFQFEEIKQDYQANKETELISMEEFSDLEKKIMRGKQGLAEIGVQDQNIIEEYKEVSERYDFLTQQISDLNKGMEDLKVLIKELEEQIEGKFNEAIKKINHQFNDYFRLIFNGGSARLIQRKEKTNNDNLSWGVDIQLNIPKTQLKGLEMLSGGEKTLVAICLLFALVEQSKIPLLVVDEIDAALDEDNSRRFSEILKALNKQTQFIIITHNRLTMSAVQVIYGITLSSDNSSQLLSLKLEEAEALAE